MKDPFGGQIEQYQQGDYCSTVAAVPATVVRLDSWRVSIKIEKLIPLRRHFKPP